MSALYEWIDPETGEVVDEEHEGAIPVEALSEAVKEDSQAFGDWVTQKLVQLDAQEEAAKRQFARAKARLASERKALERHFADLEEVTHGLLTGKKKSVMFAYGTAGFRKSTSREVVDEGAAVDWAMVNAPDALKVKTSVLKSKLPDSCPHLKVETGSKFYVRGAK